MNNFKLSQVVQGSTVGLKLSSGRLKDLAVSEWIFAYVLMLSDVVLSAC